MAASTRPSCASSRATTCASPKSTNSSSAGRARWARTFRACSRSSGAQGRMHVEHFARAAAGEPAGPSAASVAQPAPVAAAASAEVTVVMDGRRRRFSMARGGDVILDAAQVGGPRPAVLLPRRRLLHLPREARLRQRGDGAQRRARGLGGGGGLYSLLPGAPDERRARNQLRRMTATPHELPDDPVRVGGRHRAPHAEPARAAQQLQRRDARRGAGCARARRQATARACS